jgi:hypothetical protein
LDGERRGFRINGAMNRLYAIFTGAIAALGVVASPAAAGAGDDVHYFEVNVVGSGSATADFGMDGQNPNLITGSGVDGEESVRWRWQVLAVATSVGNGPLVARAETARERAVLSVSLVSWGVQNGEYGETPLCQNLQGKTRFVSSNGQGFRPTRFSRGEYMRESTSVSVHAGGFFVDSPSFASNFVCFHSYHGHGLKFVDHAEGLQAPVPRGEFNPRFDRFYEQTYQDPAHVGREHSSSDPNSAHTYNGESELRVVIRAVSERRYRRRGNRYHSRPPGEVLPYHSAP